MKKQFKNAKQKIEWQKGIAKNLYLKLDKIFSFVTVAGGAPRNWDHNMTANDIDFYVSSKKNKNDQSLYQISKALDIEFDRSEIKKKKNNLYHHPQIDNIFDFKIDGQKIQIIELKDDVRVDNFVLQDFDFNICKIFWIPDRFIRPNLYIQDKENKKLTLNFKKLSENSYQVKKIPQRYEKMKKLFPNYELVMV